MKKQLVSIVTAAALSLTFAPGTVFAEEENGGKPECTCEWLCGEEAEAECPACAEDIAACKGQERGLAPQAENGGDITNTGLHFQPSFNLPVPLVETVYTAGEGTVTWIPTVTDGVITDGLVIFDNTTFDLSAEGVPEYFGAAPYALSYQHGGYLTGNLEVRLIGENRVNAHHKMSSAISAGASENPAVLETTIKGIDGGSLVFANAATDSSYYTGISSPQLVIEDAEITLQKGIIQSLNSVVIRNSKVDVTLGGEGALPDRAIDCAAGNVSISDSNVKIVSNDFGIAAQRVTIENTEAAISGETMASGGVMEIMDSNVIAVGGSRKISAATLHSGGLWNEGPDDIEASGMLEVSPEESAKPITVKEGGALTIQNDAAFAVTLEENATLTAANAKSLTAAGDAKIVLTDAVSAIHISGGITADSGSFALEYEGDSPEGRTLLTAQSAEDAEKVTFDETKFERVDNQILWKQEQLAAPGGMLWEGAEAGWDAVQGAAGYAVQLYKDGEAYGDFVTAEMCEYDFAAQITENGSYTFCVKALGDGVRYLDGEYSAESEAYHYTAPVSAYAIAVTASAGGTARADRTSARAGETVTLSYTANSGYRFDRWTVLNGGITITGDSFRMPEEAVAVRAEFVQTGGSGGSSSGGGTGRGGASASQQVPVRTDTAAAGDTGTAAETMAEPAAGISGTTATAQVSEAIAREIIKQATENDSRTVIIAPDVRGNVSRTEVSIPADTLKSIGEQTEAVLTVSTPVASVSIENGGLGSLAGAGGMITVAAERQGNAVLLSVLADGQRLEAVSGGVTLVVPYEACSPGTVAVLTLADGTQEMIRKSFADNGALTIPLDGSASLEMIDNAKSFADVPAGHWAAGAAAFASAHGLLNGTGEGLFQPDAPMTRGMLAKALHNLESNPGVGYRDVFRDVAAEDWYAESVLWATGKGIANGYGDGRFGAMDAVTREQLAAMLWRYAGSPAADGMLRFDDADEAGTYAREALCWAVESGVMSGREGGLLAPKALATRAEAAQMLWNFILR